MTPTRLTKSELFPDKLPNSFLNRMAQTVKFLDYWQFPACDCGEDNPAKALIDPNIESIEIDFDREAFPGKWNTVFCLEVLEHLYNPLFFLESVKKSLLPGGVIFLSTPYQWPQMLKAIHHYHEIPDDRLNWLFDEAGLRILRKGKITIAGNWYDHFTGVRPFMRYFQHTRIFKLGVK